MNKEDKNQISQIILRLAQRIDQIDRTVEMVRSAINAGHMPTGPVAYGSNLDTVAIKRMLEEISED